MLIPGAVTPRGSRGMKPEDERSPRREATYEDIEALPPNMVGQLINGELIAMPRPALEHARTATGLIVQLYTAFQSGDGGPGGWWIVNEPELHFGKDVLVPDLAGWQHSRLPGGPSGPYMTLAPDWVCEVLSPSTANVDRTLKRSIYAREGVEYVWLMDPLAHTLEVFRLQEGRWVERGSWSGDVRIRAEPFHAIELRLGAFWVPASRSR
jgi:Uma2 family endonuclease